MADEYCADIGDTSSNNYCRTTNATGYHNTGWVAFTGSETELYTVQGGDFQIHSGYNSNTLKNDIALVDLDVTPTNQVLQLPTVDSFAAIAASSIADSVQVIGHGDTISDTDEDTFQQSANLMEVDLTPKTDAACSSAINGFDSNTMLCAGDPGEDSCQGDSGGPLIDPTTSTLLGIVSWGPLQCGNRTGSLGVYTDVYQYVEWIESGGGTAVVYQSGDKTIRLGNENAGAMSIFMIMGCLCLFHFRKKD
jgi:secreted trypsin-like serine protease